tara:strand:- start:197 stop:478 length:282 start_codon:yes stop_codon:yes gene_type:complete
MSETLKQSSKLLDDFEKNLLLSNNNENILDCVNLISNDIQKYTDINALKELNISEIEIKSKIQEIIKKIDHLNNLVLPKLKLNEKFADFNNQK